jgi:hypothetical protein
MNWIHSIIASLLSGVTGLFLAALISDACVSWFHISSREGASGYFVLFNALGGGIAGLIIGFITARLIVANYGAGFGKELGGALGVVLAIAGIVTLTCRLVADVPPKIDSQELNLEVEFRFPATTNTAQPPTAEGKWTVQLGSLSGHTQRTYRDGAVHSAAARLEAGRWIVPAEVLVFTERGGRSISLQHNDQHVGGILLPLPRRPGREFERWSDWLPRHQADGQPWPVDKMSYRFRVQKIPLPPPPPSLEEWEAGEAAKKEAEFAAIPADAPVQSWFPYLDYDQPQTERARQIIASRPNLTQELGLLALGDDARLAEAALRFIRKLPAPTAEFIAPVAAAGHDLAERIRKFNATTVEADPGYEGAADVSIRFSGWMEAVRTLREKCGGDFTPELKTILELSRVRTDSHAMQADVCRVASYYLHQWAGVEPLPTDPKPR